MSGQRHLYAYKFSEKINSFPFPVVPKICQTVVVISMTGQFPQFLSYLEAPFLLPAKSALDPDTDPAIVAGNLLPLTRYLAASKNSLKSFSYSLHTDVR